MSASSASRNDCFTTGRTVTYPASSSVKRTAMVSGSGMQNEGCEFSAHFRETVAHAIAEHFAVNGLAFQSRLSCLHDGAHLLDRSRGGFGDCFGDGRVHFGFAGAGGQIRFDDGDLFRFLFDAFPALALCQMAPLFPAF